MTGRAEGHECIQIVLAGPSLDWFRTLLPPHILLTPVPHDEDDLPTFVLGPTQEALDAVRRG